MGTAAQRLGVDLASGLCAALAETLRFPMPANKRAGPERTSGPDLRRSSLRVLASIPVPTLGRSLGTTSGSAGRDFRSAAKGAGFDRSQNAQMTIGLVEPGHWRRSDDTHARRDRSSRAPDASEVILREGSGSTRHRDPAVARGPRGLSGQRAAGQRCTLRVARATAGTARIATAAGRSRTRRGRGTPRGRCPSGYPPAVPRSGPRSQTSAARPPRRVRCQTWR